jgi:putative transposase
VAVLLEASRGATRSASAPVVLADAGVENVNAQVDELIDTGVLRRLQAFTELKFSNSMIEAWWRCLKHQWLFLYSLDSVATIRRLEEAEPCPASDSLIIDRPLPPSTARTRA